jgi:hypothetical protein
MNPKSYVVTWTSRSNKHSLDLDISIGKDIRHTDSNPWMTRLQINLIAWYLMCTPVLWVAYRLAFTWKKFRTWCTVGPLFTNLYFGQTGQTNRETEVPWISHRRSVGGRGLRSCPVPYLNTEIKFCVGKTSPTMPNLNWLHCKLLFHSILLFISWPDRRCLVQSKFQ